MSAWIWLVLGAILVLAELFVPGLVVIFPGLGALLVALGVALGLVPGLPAQVALWIASSLLLMVGLRRLGRRYLPAEMSRALVDEQALVHGQVVEVLEDVSDSEEPPFGRVRHQGTTWAARTVSGRIEKGRRAVIVYRDGLSLVVEPDEVGGE